MLGALIGAGSSLIGGLLGNKSAKDAAKANLKAQKQFAQNGIQWKVKDAQKAGIHPLYALGAQTTSFTPSFVGSNSLAEGVAQAGQNIGRAIDSGHTSNERMSNRLEALTVQRAELENAKLASEIALLQQPGSPPAALTENPIIPGQGQIKTSPSETVSNLVGEPTIEAALMPSVQYRRTKSGVEAVIPPKLAESLESDKMGAVKWWFENKALPAAGMSQLTTRPPASWLPPGADTWVNHLGEWKPFNSKTAKVVPMIHRR